MTPDAPNSEHRAVTRRRVAGVPLTSLVIAALAGVVALVCATELRSGLGATPDAAIALSMADNLHAGKGLTTPVGFVFHGFSPSEMVSFGDRLPSQGFPPLYPTLLALGPALGADARQAAGLLNIAGAVGVVVLVGYVTSSLTRGSAVTVALVGAWTIVQADLLLVTQLIQPEAPFSFLILLQVVVVWRFVRGGRGGSFIACVAVTALAVLFRQLGFALVASGATIMLLRLPGPLERRVRTAFVFSLASVLPMLVYWVVSSEPGSSAGFTQFALHPPDGTDYALFLSTMRRWFVEYQSLVDYGGLAWLLGCSAVVLAALGWRTRQHPDRSADTQEDDETKVLGLLLALTIVSYLLVLWGSSTILDDDVEFGGRYLIPIQPLAFALIGAGLCRLAWSRRLDLPRLGPALALVATLGLVHHAAATREVLALERRDIGTAAADQILQLPPDAVIFSDKPEDVYVSTARGAYVSPARINRYTGESNPALQDDLAELQQLASQRPVYLVYSNQPTREYLASLDEIQSAMSLTEVARTWEDTIYRVGPLPTPSGALGS